MMLCISLNFESHMAYDYSCKLMLSSIQYYYSLFKCLKVLVAQLVRTFD